MAIHRDPIFKGCTRPATMAGVPFVPLICTGITFGLVAVWGGLLLGPVVVAIAVVCAASCLIAMREICRRDDQRFRQIGLWLQLRGRNRNRRFWGAVSYAATRVRRFG